MEDNKDFDYEDVTVTLDLDDGTSVECEIVTIFEVEGREYIALLPLASDGTDEEGEVFLYGFSLVDDEPSLRFLEDDDEYDIAAEAFDEWLDQNEYDELIDMDEE